MLPETLILNCFQNFHKSHQSLNIWYQSFTKFDGQVIKTTLFMGENDIPCNLHKIMILGQNGLQTVKKVNLMGNVVNNPETPGGNVEN